MCAVITCTCDMEHGWTPTAAKAVFLTTCSDDSKPYMILKALDESYKNNTGFGIMRASGEEQRLPTSSLVSATVLSSVLVLKG